MVVQPRLLGLYDAQLAVRPSLRIGILPLIDYWIEDIRRCFPTSPLPCSSCWRWRSLPGRLHSPLFGAVMQELSLCFELGWLWLAYRLVAEGARRRLPAPR